jgi:hypothetical protein
MSAYEHRARFGVPIVLTIWLIASGLASSAVAVAASAPTSGTYFGAYVQPSDWSKAGQKSSVTNLEADLGRKLNIDHLFYQWDGVFPGWRQTWDIDNGRIPMISWGGTTLSQILNGSQDALIRARADGLKALGSPVLLRWFPEMDAGPNSSKISSPAQFVSAWKKLHGIFVARGATNVEWVWCPNAYRFATGEAQQYYPGDAYVDWICADGYNWAPQRPNSNWTSFKDIFAAFYAWGAPKAPPLMIGETGVLEKNPGDKGAWVTDMGNTIKTVYPEIKALVYFDAYSSANFGGMWDWRVDTSSSSYNAFKALAANPYFDPGSGGGGGQNLFSDGFESGNLSKWTAVSDLTLQNGGAHGGSWAAVAQSTGPTVSDAVKSLSSTYSELYARTWFKVMSQSTTVNLLRLQSSTGANVLTLFVSSSGDLMLRNDVGATNLWSPTTVTKGAWHQVQVRAKVSGSSSLTQVWFDGQLIAELSKTMNLGSTPIGRMMLGDSVMSRTYKVLFDDVVASASLIT